MKKETIAAIVFGIIFGSVLGIFLITKNKQSQREKTKFLVPTGVETQTSKVVLNNVQILELLEPQDRAIVYKNSIQIKGNAVKNSLLLIQSPIKETVINHESDKFSEDFPLALGENVIRISVYPNNKQLQTQEKELRIFYFTEKL